MIAALAAVTAIAASAAGNGQKAKTAATRADDTFFTSGGLFTGVNYWASHAGTYMWRRWDAKTVEKDFAALRAQGVDTLRVFPLWPDFQPLTRMIGNVAPLTEGVLQSDMPLSNPAGVDEEMMKRFRLMCDAARRHDMKLVVGLITGWMSGRRFLPPALEDKNPICNPESIKWQVRFVRHFVREMRDHPAIAAWDLGNECNTFGGNRDEEGNSTNPLAAIALMILGPIAASLIQMAISRRREYMADAAGASYCGDPMALAYALNNLDAYSRQIPMQANPATENMFIVNPLTGGSVQRLFSTHPPMEERIANLQEMAQTGRYPQ